MTARIGDEPNMDVYKDVIESGAVQFLDFTPRDIAAMNLHDAAEYQARHARIAHPHYKRHGRIDGVTGEWVPYTADELADRAYERKWRRRVFALYGVLVLAAGVAVLLAILQQNGLLS